MQMNTIAVLMPGDMGHAVGRSLITADYEVICALEGRGEHTRKLAAQGGLRDVGNIAAIVDKADLILSILPPAAALGLAKTVAREIQDSGKFPIYVDCNAIAPNTAIEIGKVIESAGAVFVDAGIIGAPPGQGSGPRFYVSGPDLSAMLALNGSGFQVIGMGSDIGQGSAIKMAYAGLTKGTWTLHTAVLLAAKQMGVGGCVVTRIRRISSASAWRDAHARPLHPCRFCPMGGRDGRNRESLCRRRSNARLSRRCSRGFPSSGRYAFCSRNSRRYGSFEDIRRRAKRICETSAIEPVA